jgi:hypothetical protein
MYLGTHSLRRVSRVENLGAIIVLDDGSRWEVSLMDKAKSMTWLMTDQVKVESHMMQYRLTNQNRGSSVVAKHLG